MRYLIVKRHGRLVRLLRTSWNVMRSPSHFRSASGFSLIEIMLVVCLVGILGAMASFQIGSVRPGMLGDGAMRSVMAEFNQAREMAIAQRRKMQVNFVGTNHIQVVRIDSATTTTQLRDVAFESGVQYGLVASIADTPDAFGKLSAQSFGGAATIRFNTEGALIDPSGAPVNGTVFLIIPGQNLSYRAVTVQGSTGRVRGFKWIGNQWRR